MYLSSSICQAKFLRLLESRAKNFVRSGLDVVIVGDVNISHKRIDHCDPYEVNFQLFLSSATHISLQFPLLN